MAHLTSDLNKTEAPQKPTNSKSESAVGVGSAARARHSSKASKEAWARAYQIANMTGCSTTEARQLYARIDPISKKTIKWCDGRSLRAAINRLQTGTTSKQTAPIHVFGQKKVNTLQVKLRAIADYIDACGNIKTAIAHIDALAAVCLSPHSKQPNDNALSSFTSSSATSVYF